MNETILTKLCDLPGDWHGAGTATPDMLRAISRHCETLTKRLNSVETGAGKTTLLFSHVFAKHEVFAFDAGGSVAKVRESALLKPNVVSFVDGPTQVTLPVTALPEEIDCALLDGPHGYPFPDLEYYYIYPKLREGALLILDDVQIPTIHRLLDILAADPMYEHLETVGYTAFLRRTSEPMVNPLGDDWWKQGYNKKTYEKFLRKNAFKASMAGRFLLRIRQLFRG